MDLKKKTATSCVVAPLIILFSSLLICLLHNNHGLDFSKSCKSASLESSMQSGIRLDRLLFSNGNSNEFRYPNVRMVIQLSTKGAMEARRNGIFVEVAVYIP